MFLQIKSYECWVIIKTSNQTWSTACPRIRCRLDVIMQRRFRRITRPSWQTARLSPCAWLTLGFRKTPQTNNSWDASVQVEKCMRVRDEHILCVAHCCLQRAGKQAEVELHASLSASSLLWVTSFWSLKMGTNVVVTRANMGCVSFIIFNQVVMLYDNFF